MYDNIVIPIDLEDDKAIHAALPPALNFVSNFKGKLHLIYVIPDFSNQFLQKYVSAWWQQRNINECEQAIADVVNKYIPSDIEVNIYISQGDVADEVISYSKSINSDLIILPALSPPLRDYMIGQNAARIVRKSLISVLVVKG